MVRSAQARGADRREHGVARDDVAAFNIPGIYREIRSVYSFADLPMIQAMVIETTMLIVVANTLADLIQAAMDPRLR